MSVRPDVHAFVALGPLLDSHTSEDRIAAHQACLLRIAKPVSDDEAALLLSCFGPDDCYGLAWTLLHLIETAPRGAKSRFPPRPGDNEWIHQLWQRDRNRAHTNEP